MPKYRITFRRESGQKGYAIANASNFDSARNLAAKRGLEVESIQLESDNCATTAAQPVPARTPSPLWFWWVLGGCAVIITGLVSTLAYVHITAPTATQIEVANVPPDASPPGPVLDQPTLPPSPPTNTQLSNIAAEDRSVESTSPPPKPDLAIAEPQRERTFADVVQDSSSAFAVIKTPRGSGSGFLIAPGVLATNNHVLRDVFLDELLVYFPATSTDSFRVRHMIVDDEHSDITLLGLPTTGTALAFDAQYKPRPGEEIIVIGSPAVGHELVLENAVSRGVFSTPIELSGRRLLQFSVSINPGNSGGPILSRDGLVLAMSTLRATKQEGIAFGIPASDIWDRYSRADRSDVACDTVATGHDCRAVYRRCRSAAKIYAFSMKQYVNMMDLSITGGETSSDGVRAIRSNIDELLKVTNEHLNVDRVRACLQRLQLASLDTAVKSELLNLWTIVDQFRSYASEPRGSFVSYRDKQRELQDEYDRSDQRLQILLNITDKDD